MLMRPMLFLGTLSYSIYMVQIFTQARILNALTFIGPRIGRPNLVIMEPRGAAIGVSPLFADTVTIGMVLLVVAVAWCTYHLTERPGQRWSRRLVLGGGHATRSSRAEESAPTF